MCDNCFTSEIPIFPDKHSWDKFDLELTKKISEGILKEFEFIRDTWRDKDDGFFQYQCQSCGQKWKMKDPDLPWDPAGFHGYFLKTSRLKSNGTPGASVLKMACVVIGLIVIRILYYLFFE
jgi:hypothetical protein